MTVQTDAEVRAGLLIEMLLEEATEQGQDVPEPPPEAKTWPEDAIRTYFKTGGKVAPAPVHPRIPAPDAATFAKWFPGLELSKTACAQPRLRVLCFPNAGSAEDMYTSEGTGPRKAPSPLLEWCRAHQAEVLAVQPPGRNMRNKEPPLTSCQAMAEALLPVVAHRLYDVPYVIVAHSVGTWNAFEFLRLARKRGVPMPSKAFLSAFAAPDLPEPQRPWSRQRTLGEAEFKDECRGWDVNEVVFSAAMWGSYQPLMRADFTLFDEYEHLPGEPPFTFPLTTFYGSRDHRIQEWMVQEWQRFSTGAFRCLRLDGNHLWPLDREAKKRWLEVIAAELADMQLH